MTYYEVLGVPRNASYEQIKKQYRILAKRYHPDMNKSPDSNTSFGKLSRAYQTLNDPYKRGRYDEMLENQDFEGLETHFGKSSLWFTDPFKLFDNLFKGFKDPFLDLQKLDKDAMKGAKFRSYSSSTLKTTKDGKTVEKNSIIVNKDGDKKSYMETKVNNKVVKQEGDPTLLQSGRGYKSLTSNINQKKKKTKKTKRVYRLVHA